MSDNVQAEQRGIATCSDQTVGFYSRRPCALRSGASVLSNFGMRLQSRSGDLVTMLFLSAIRQMKALSTPAETSPPLVSRHV